MKRIILLLSVVVLTISVKGQTQVVPQDVMDIVMKRHYPTSMIGKENDLLQKIKKYSTQSVNNKTAICVDTIYYPQSKMTSFSGFQLINETNGFLVGVSQNYNASIGLVHGIDAFVMLDTNGIPGDATPIDAYIKVFNVGGPFDKPFGPAIDSTLVTINDLGTTSQTLLFATPVPVSARYAVAIEFNPLTSVPNNDTLWYLGNNNSGPNPDGNGEGLMSLNFPFFGGWTNFFNEFGSSNYDALFSPIFEQTITSAYISDEDTVCLGSPVLFTNTSVFDTNYMYNRYDSLNVEPYAWNYDDGTGIYSHEDTSYTFSTAGNFDTQLLITTYGYTANCIDSTQLEIEVLALPNVATSIDTLICMGGTADISATGAISYSWDNGLGAGQNQSVSPIVDTMYVVTGQDGFGCFNTDTVDVTINALPNVQTNADTILCDAGESYTILATGATSYFWDNGLGAGQNHVVSPLATLTYTVVGTDAVGCVNSDSVTVAVANCSCLDTIYYPHSKMNSFSQFQLLNETNGFVNGVSQNYNANTGLVHGVNAYILLDTNGIAGDAAPLDAYIKVFNVGGPFDKPFGPAIDSNLVTISDIGTANQTLLFTTPVPVSARYAVAIEFNPLTSVPNNDTLWYLGNNNLGPNPDGNGEGLMSLNFPIFGGWTNFFNEFGSSNYDALLSPIFEKTIASAYTTDADTVCLESPITFTNTSILDTNYMYNRFDSLNVEPYEWNYGDGAGVFNHFDTAYTFASAGTFNTELLVINYGYTTTCFDTAFQTVQVLETTVVASVDTAICLGDTVNLSATGASNYTWDNGLGVGQNQSATPLVDTDFIVTTTNTFGCSGSDTVAVTINPLPTVISSVDTTICEGGTVNLSATGALTYTWDNGLGAGQNQTANPLIDTMYIVTGENSFSCVDMDTVNVTINAAPTVIASNDTTICIGDTANISATSALAVFTWDNGLGTGQNQDVNPITLTTYIVSVTDGIGCDGFDTVNVSVNQIPVLTTNTDTAVCFGDSITLFATGALTYTWDNGLGIGQNHSILPIDTTYIVSGSDAASCIGIDSVQVTINPLPTVISSVDTTICEGGTVNLSATGALTYTWDNGLGVGQNQTANPIIDTMYIVTGENSFSCVDMDTVNVTINAAPTVIASNDTTICIGDTANISATSALLAFNWDNGLGAGQSQNVSPTVLTSYIVSVIDVIGCEGFDTVNVDINQLPLLTTNTDTALCVADSITLFATGASTYNWDNTLGAGQNHLLLPIDTTYIVTGTDAIGCVGTDSVVVTINQLPVVIASNDTSICLGFSTTISATGASSLTWNNGLGAGDSHEITPTETITYIVTGDENGCITSDTVLVSINNMCFNLPNVFTPNGDGKNDLWNIGGVAEYPEMVVKVFNRWGDLVFGSEAGYVNPWDGTYNGTVSPSATYYYIIDLGNGEEGLTGTINIIK